ncbi:MAG: MBL fold metallo-hydrolase [Desulfovibrio sp.]|jgi:glyoxylase-like metal-dependent hydrolase (beta-lactamase superfamily II)|nr:MBL fold metallo-hydrolase [Desulfovibrio sp.]
MKLAENIYFYPEDPSCDGAVLNAGAVVIDGAQKLIIDPGSEKRLPFLVKRMTADGLDPATLDLALFTHSHPDHLGAGRALRDTFGVAPAMHRLETDFLTGTGFGFNRRSFAREDFTVLEEGEFRFGGHRFHLYLTPGHSPGGLTLHWPEAKLLVVGDVYFQGTFGATDLPGGSEPEMFRTLEKLEKLEDVELVLCGHGPAIAGREAIEENYRVLAREVAMKKAGTWPGYSDLF